MDLYSDLAMNQNRYNLLVSLALLVLLTVGFFFAARFVSGALKSSIDRAVATSTPTAVVLPTPTRTGATPTPHVKHHPITTTTKTAPVASPTPTPQNNNLVVSTTPDAADAQTTFPATTLKFWCVTNFKSVPANAQLVYAFQHLLSNTVVPVFTSQAYPYPSVTAAFLDGPQPSGQYRCQVLINGQLAATANFTVK